MDSSPVLYDEDDRLAILTMNRPERRNALSRRMLTGILEALDHAETNGAVRVVVVRAVGPVFSAGHDLTELTGGTKADCADLFALCSRVMNRVRSIPKPVLAQVQGLATAAGCQLAATCDLVVAAESASFATPGVKIGLFCTTPGVAVARAVPTKKAMEMLLTGTPIGAREAERVGLVNRVVPDKALDQATRDLAREIAGYSSYCLGTGKRAFYEQIALEVTEAYQRAEKVMLDNALHPDGQEGMRAFLEKRRPRWSD